MKAMNGKVLKRKQLNTMVKAINQTAGRAVHLFIISLMEVLQDKMTQSELIEAYDLFCNRMPDELQPLKDDDVADEMLDRRLAQIVNDELIQEGKQEVLLEKMYALLKGE